MAYNSHGHTPAAWTTVLIVFLAFVFGSIAVLVQNWPLFWIGGVGLLVVGGIVGKVMQMMGLGQGENPALTGRQCGAEAGTAEGMTVREGMAAPEGTPSQSAVKPDVAATPAEEAAG